MQYINTHMCGPVAAIENYIIVSTQRNAYDFWVSHVCQPHKIRNIIYVCKQLCLNSKVCLRIKLTNVKVTQFNRIYAFALVDREVQQVRIQNCSMNFDLTVLVLNINGTLMHIVLIDYNPQFQFVVVCLSFTMKQI